MHAYFGRRIFLSLLAGKFATFEQMLLTDQAAFLKWRMRITSARIFFKKFFGGKMFYLKQPLARIEPTKFTN